jgi:hypothetical protein
VEALWLKILLCAVLAFVFLAFDDPLLRFLKIDLICGKALSLFNGDC